MAGGSYSGFRPAGALAGATGLPVGLHLQARKDEAKHTIYAELPQGGRRVRLTPFHYLD
jgi:hypothetical protein